MWSGSLTSLSAGNDALGGVAAEIEVIGDAIAGMEIGDAGSDRDHFARGFVAGDERQARRLVEAGAEIDVDEVEADGVLADADLARSGRRHLDVLINQRFRAPYLVHAHGLGHDDGSLAFRCGQAKAIGAVLSTRWRPELNPAGSPPPVRRPAVPDARRRPTRTPRDSRSAPRSARRPRRGRGGWRRCRYRRAWCGASRARMPSGDGSALASTLTMAERPSIALPSHAASPPSRPRHRWHPASRRGRSRYLPRLGGIAEHDDDVVAAARCPPDVDATPEHSDQSWQHRLVVDRCGDLAERHGDAERGAPRE